MGSPFPGMDPYLEQPAFWSELHGNLIFRIQEALNPVLPISYVATVEPRIEVGYWDLEDSRFFRPDVVIEQETPMAVSPASGVAVVFTPLELDTIVREEIEVFRVRVIHRESNRLVTAIEILSPINKRPGNKAYDEYVRKREDLLDTSAHLLEIDLLRKGRRVPMFHRLPDAAYFIILGRSDRRPTCEVWPLQLADPLPTEVHVPLLRTDPDVTFDLAAIFQAAYEAGRFGDRIDYSADPPEPLSDAQRAWVSELLAEKR